MTVGKTHSQMIDKIIVMRRFLFNMEKLIVYKEIVFITILDQSLTLKVCPLGAVR